MTAPDILRYAAFTTQPGGGNPAGVVLDAATLTDAEMQQIAIDVDDAETAFVTGATGDGAVAVRYFSPVAEMPFCGHATVATAIAGTSTPPARTPRVRSAFRAPSPTATT